MIAPFTALKIAFAAVLASPLPLLIAFPKKLTAFFPRFKRVAGKLAIALFIALKIDVPEDFTKPTIAFIPLPSDLIMLLPKLSQL